MAVRIQRIALVVLTIWLLFLVPAMAIYLVITPLVRRSYYPIISEAVSGENFISFIRVNKTATESRWEKAASITVYFFIPPDPRGMGSYDVRSYNVTLHFSFNLSVTSEHDIDLGINYTFKVNDQDAGSLRDDYHIGF